MVEVSVGSKGVEESLLNIHADMPCLLLPSSSVCSTATTEAIIELSVCLELSERRKLGKITSGEQARTQL